MEYARHVAGIRTAAHEEYATGGTDFVISRLVCSLADQVHSVTIFPGTKTFQAYGKYHVDEAFRCNYGLNPNYREAIIKNPLMIAGEDEEKAVRIIELSDHPFYIATLFLPQLSSNPRKPHPLVTAFLKAALAFHHQSGR